jgi:uncharacterized membrane protein
MTRTAVTTALWFLALGSGLLGGVFFAFSAFVMKALSRLPPAHGAAAMNAISLVIVKSVFMPIFLGTAFASLSLGAVCLFRPSQTGATLILAACTLTFAGMFIVTLAFNVPLNNALAADASVWARYVKDWTFWNHVRTLSSLIACGLFIAALRMLRP